MRVFTVTLVSALVCAACAREPEPGTATPALVFPRLDAAGDVQLADYCGRVVHLELWGSWCGPCVDSMAAADRLRATLRRQDFEVIGISLDPESAAASAFLGAHPVEFPNVWDADRRVQSEFAVDGVPTAILIDRRGRVRERFAGFNARQDAALRDAVHALVKERGPDAGSDDCRGA